MSIVDYLTIGGAYSSFCPDVPAPRPLDNTPLVVCTIAVRPDWEQGLIGWHNGAHELHHEYPALRQTSGLRPLDAYCCHVAIKSGTHGRAYDPMLAFPPIVRMSCDYLHAYMTCFTVREGLLSCSFDDILDPCCVIDCAAPTFAPNASDALLSSSL